MPRRTARCRTPTAKTAGALVRAALGEPAAALLACEGALHAQLGPAAVHDARVAVRRLRADLRSFAPFLEPHWNQALRADLRALGGVLGRARDADVLVERAGAHAAPGPVPAELAAERERAYASLRALLAQPRHAALVARAAEAGVWPALTAAAGASARAVMPGVLGSAWKALRKAVRRRARPPSDRDLHRIRIKAKRLRYLAEAFAPLGGKRLRKLARALAALQDALGEQHDAAVARDRLRGLGMPELSNLEQRAAAAAARAWRPCWRRVKACRKAAFARVVSPGRRPRTAARANRRPGSG